MMRIVASLQVTQHNHLMGAKALSARKSDKARGNAITYAPRLTVGFLVHCKQVVVITLPFGRVALSL